MKKRSILLIVSILLMAILLVPLYSQTGSFGGARKKTTVYVTINSNVRGASVTIGRYRGRTPFRIKLVPGKYSIEVSAPGYNTFRGSVTVLSKRTTQYISISLTPLLVRVRINVTNVSRARLYVDGRYKGHTPISLRLEPRMYNIRLEAEGFMPLSTRLNIRSSRREERYNFTLKPMNATLDIIIPAKYINRRDKDAFRLIKVYVDNRLINRKGEIKKLQVRPGKHRVRIVSGGLSVEREFNFEAGVVYTLELYMKMKLGRREGKREGKR